MYNAYPYFPSKIWAKKCTLHMAKYSNCQNVSDLMKLRNPEVQKSK